MDDRDTLQERLLTSFDAELVERTAALDHGLVVLEETDGAGMARGAFAELYRLVYNLQGAARAVDLVEVAHLASALAAAFDAAQRLEVPPGVAWYAAARRAVAFFARLAESARAGLRSPDFFEVLADLVASPDHTPPATSASQTPNNVPAALASPAARLAASVRVNVGTLDALLAQSGELAVARIRVEQRLAELTAVRDDLGDWRRDWRASRRLRASVRRRVASLADEPTLVREVEALLRAGEGAEARALALGQQVAGLAARLHQDVAQLEQVAQELAGDVLEARLVPAATIFAPFERLVRDLAREEGKPIDLVLYGGDTAIDRRILERLRDPLMHMLRNAVDHGVEPPGVRAAAGKPPTSQIRLVVANRGSTIEFTLADDGAGIDPARLRAAAVRRGLVTEAHAAALDDQAAYALIFQPGFSTTSVATATSGRGVGMDVVRDEVSRLNGHVRTASVLGQGTTFTITVPLTLATTRAILVEQTGRCYAIPSTSVERAARVRVGEIVLLEGRRAVLVDGHPVPIVELADVLALPPDAWPADQRAWRSFIVLRQDERRLALLLDRFIGEQELVIKPLGWPLRRVRNVSGAAILSSGDTVAILNPADLLLSGLPASQANGGRASGPAAQPTDLAAPAGRQRVLIVDDSLTTRLLERGILEAAGYDTAVAADGAEALSLLARDPIDLVVSDVDMPNLDGYGLAAAIRRDEHLRHLPIVLVTSLDTPEQRERGMAAGADAYLSKRTFDQAQLLDTIGRLL